MLNQLVHLVRSVGISASMVDREDARLDLKEDRMAREERASMLLSAIYCYTLSLAASTSAAAVSSQQSVAGNDR